jgi:abnormal spindle-like microcephaly-associated protein
MQQYLLFIREMLPLSIYVILQVLSMRAYSVRRELNRLRRGACLVWQSPHVARTVAKVEVEVEKQRLAVRKDKDLNKDVGMKRTFLELLLSYNPLWLRIGLETIFGEVRL